MSDDFQRDALAPLMCPRHDCESTRHALNQLRVENKHLRAEIERLQRERDALAAKVASYEHRYDAHDGTTAAHERRITRCRTCQARIVWLKTAAGKNMPVDADSVEPGDETFEYGRHVSHFSTCKQADQHRRRK